MNAYVLSREAEQDLDDLWDYLADESVDAADRLTGMIFEAFEELALPEHRSPTGRPHKISSALLASWQLPRHLSCNEGSHRDRRNSTWET
jgi:plasmid stabilization system protein ParE